MVAAVRQVGLTIIGAAVMLCGCSDSHKAHQQQAARMIYSPNGEPLNGGPLGKPTCKDAMSGWFARVDANHDGVISHEEFLADARIQFSRMDIDSNGYLVSEEVERFRQPYRQGTTALIADNGQGNASPQPQQGGHQHGGGHHRGGGDSGAGSKQDVSSDDTSDPVMSADTNLDFKVTPEEFMTHAQKVFLELDSDHNGSLSRDEVQARCPKE